MLNSVAGDTSSLKPAQARALGKLAERTTPPAQLVSAALARDLVDLARELNRQVGLYIDRRGRVVQVILGDAHSLQLPPTARARGVEGRLCGVRLVFAHLVPDPLSREELADLTKLRLDATAAIHLGPSGLTVDIAALAPGKDGDIFQTRVFPRAPLSFLTRDEVATGIWAQLPVPFDEWLRDAENALVQVATQARANQSGIRAMALMVSGKPGGLAAREAELLELARTAGVNLVDIVVQRRPHPDPRTFFGIGKLREVLVRALEQDVELLICDPDMSPSQAREVSEMTDIKVIDRTILILDIFAQHAKSADGKLQVELAQQRYRLPRLIGKGTAMSRLAGGIGGRGPGETKLEIDRRRAKDRISELERRLKTMRGQREQRRASRQRAQVPVVAIVGYTNAGKSTLLNTVTESDVRAENKLFATLDPTVRRLRFPTEREIVLLDTVGFIRELPAALMQAFSATLEEIRDADLLLHIIDATDPDRDQQIATVEGILDELEAAAVPRFMVFNKCDRLEGGMPEDAPETNTFHISAVDRRSTRRLMQAVEERLWREGADEVEPDVGQGGDDAEGDDDARHAGTVDRRDSDDDVAQQVDMASPKDEGDLLLDSDLH